MRWMASLLSAMLVVVGAPLPAAGSEPNQRAGLAAGETRTSSRFERPWLQSIRGASLAQAEKPSAIGDVDARIAELQARRTRTNLGKPVTAMIAGGVLLSPGILVLAVDHSTGYVVAGTIIVAGAVGLLGSGAWFYARRTRERRAIDREIEQLERARASRAATSWGLGFDLGERKGIRLSWRY